MAHVVTAKAMLLWELLLPAAGIQRAALGDTGQVRRAKWLPGDPRCAAYTRSGRRCRGRARAGTGLCVFHDQAITDETRRANALKAARTRRAKPRLPKGYPQRLKTRDAACAALERLYLETRTGLVTPEQGQVLLGILGRMLERAPNLRPPKKPQPRTTLAASGRVNGTLARVAPAGAPLDLFMPPPKPQVDLAVHRLSPN